MPSAKYKNMIPNIKNLCLVPETNVVKKVQPASLLPDEPSALLHLHDNVGDDYHSDDHDDDDDDAPR